MVRKFLADLMLCSCRNAAPMKNILQNNRTSQSQIKIAFLILLYNKNYHKQFAKIAHFQDFNVQIIHWLKIDRIRRQISSKKLTELFSNQIFHYTRCNTPKRVMSLRGPYPRHCARATQLLWKKCRCGGKPLTTLCPI